MRLQDHLVATIERAFEEAFRAARAVPDEWLAWRPLDEGQSVLAMARELAMTPDWAYWTLTDARPDDPENAAKAQKAEMASWTTVAHCEEVCRSKCLRLFDFYRALSDERLNETRWLPFNGGRDHTLLELLDYPRWNAVYHLGQIAYIGSLRESSIP